MSHSDVNRTSFIQVEATLQYGGHDPQAATLVSLLERFGCNVIKICKDDLDVGLETFQHLENFKLHLLLQKRVQRLFPNIEIALLKYLDLMVSNCS